MGDPRKARKKYKGPGHPWQGARIIAERKIKNDYGLKNKKEIWKAASELRRIKSQVKRLIREKAKGSKQAFVEEKQLLDRLVRYGLIGEGSQLDGVLSLQLENILGRRLQTLVNEQGLSLTPIQARQFIVHGHILVNGKKVNIPSYLVNLEEAANIQFSQNSSLSKDDHPERVKERKSRDETKVEVKEESAGTAVVLTEEELEKIEKELVAEITE